jgi:hypothetical protein
LAIASCLADFMPFEDSSIRNLSAGDGDGTGLASDSSSGFDDDQSEVIRPDIVVFLLREGVCELPTASMLEEFKVGLEVEVGDSGSEGDWVSSIVVISFRNSVPGSVSLTDRMVLSGRPFFIRVTVEKKKLKSS